MGLASATLSGARATAARIQIPAWGVWYADATLDAARSLSGRVSLAIADLEASGTIVSGGPGASQTDRAAFTVVGGAGGWGRIIPPKSYANDAGVKASKVLLDAAREVGEELDGASLAAADRPLGPSWVRPAGMARDVMDAVFPRGWYVDLDGRTYVGRRPAVASKGGTLQNIDRAMAVATLAADSISGLVPGATVEGLEAIDVEHEIDASTGLRTRLFATRGGNGSRRLDALRKIIESMLPDRRFRGIYDYRVTTPAGKRWNLQPIRVSTGMPNLLRVPVRGGAAGYEATLALTGATVLVSFVDADPSRPAITGFDSPDAPGFLPIDITIAQGLLGVARMTDPVVAGPFGGTVTMGSLKVRCG